MCLFDRIERTWAEPASHGESSFSFLNRSALPEEECIREQLELWFDRLPENGKMELRNRFRDQDDRQHLGAFFELYCHEMLVRQGYTVELHQSPPNGKKTCPDFLVKVKDEPLFYLETTLAAESNDDQAESRRKNQLYDLLDLLDSPNFFLGIEIVSSSVQVPGSAPIRAFLRDWLSQLDPDQVSMQYERNQELPKITWTDNHEWEIEFTAIPKKKEARGTPGVRPLGMFFQQPRRIDSRSALLRSLKSKAGYYGELDLPFIIAVDAVDEWVFESDFSVSSALFGKEILHFDRRSLELLPSTREPNGLWWGPKGPRFTRVSGVLFAFQNRPFSCCRKTPELWLNPWATRVFDPVWWEGPQRVPDMVTGQMEKRSGRNAWETLGLNPTWPMTNSGAPPSP